MQRRTLTTRQPPRPSRTTGCEPRADGKLPRQSRKVNHVPKKALQKSRIAGRTPMANRRDRSASPTARRGQTTAPEPHCQPRAEETAATEPQGQPRAEDKPPRQSRNANRAPRKPPQKSRKTAHKPRTNLRAPISHSEFRISPAVPARAQTPVPALKPARRKHFAGPQAATP